MKKEEFYQIIEPIVKHQKFQELKKYSHHGITRYEHCLRVSYYTFCLTKPFHLKYKEATIGALLHDFFFNEVEKKSRWKRLRNHPEYALKNAQKYFLLTPLEIDIIKTHMFPITSKVPKYIESWLVNLIDDISAILEKFFL